MSLLFRFIPAVIISFTIIAFEGVFEEQSSHQEIVKNMAKEFVADKLNNPSSYEFVSIKIIDSTNIGENILETKSWEEKSLSFAKNRVKSQRDYEKSNPFLFDRGELERYIKEIEKSEDILAKLDSIESALRDKVKLTTSYLYSVIYMAENEDKLLELNTVYIQTTKCSELVILNITKEEDHLLITPNGFPGQEEIFLKYI